MLYWKSYPGQAGTIHMKKNPTLLLCIDDMIVYIENPKEIYRHILPLVRCNRVWVIHKYTQLYFYAPSTILQIPLLQKPVSLIMIPFTLSRK